MAAAAGVAADFDMTETLEIIGKGLGPKIAALYQASAQPPRGAALSGEIVEVIRVTVAEAVRAAVSETVRMIAQAPEATALPPPPISDSTILRARLREAMGNWVRLKKVRTHEAAYNRLYEAFRGAYGIDLKGRAKERGVSALGYAEAEGHLAHLAAVATRLYPDA
jgi:hypothetical protein